MSNNQKIVFWASHKKTGIQKILTRLTLAIGLLFLLGGFGLSAFSYLFGSFIAIILVIALPF